MSKPVVKIRNVEVVQAEEIFGDVYKGEAVAFGEIAERDHRGWPEGTPIRTSLIEKVYDEGDTIETMNTIYKVVE